MAYVLEAADFAKYPPRANAMATKNLVLLRWLPPVFAALLLSAVIDYDWRFPAEQADVERQLAYLGDMDAGQLAAAMAGFAGLALSPELEAVRWGTAPAAFIES